MSRITTEHDLWATAAIRAAWRNLQWVEADPATPTRTLVHKIELLIESLDDVDRI